MVTVGLYGIRDTTHGKAPTYTHDHGIAVMRRGRVETVLALERWTRRKNDNRLDQYLPELLDAAGIGDEPVRFVSVNAFVGDSFQTADGNFRIEPTAAVGIEARLVPARVRWYPDGLRPGAATGWALCHEFAHVASVLPFVGRFEPESLLVHIDGGASDSASSFWSWDGREARLLESSWERLKVPVNNFNVNPLVRAILGFGSHEHLSIPGKLMGYAGHGTARPALLAWLEEQRFFLDGPEDPVVLLDLVNRRFGTRWAAFDAQEELCRDLCATLQHHFEETVCAAILGWQRQTGAHHLYYAGGAALNIPTNARLEMSGAFRTVHVPPCTNDTGLALGAAAWAEFLDRGEVEVHSPFLGRTAASSHATSLDEVDAVADLLAEGRVLAFCNGAAEIGPRALGHRSILARPDRLDLRRRVSETLKQREWYRPVAPVLLREVAEQAFGAPVARSHLAPFMLGAWRLLPGWRERFAGVLHADDSLRAQVIREDDPEQVFLGAVLARLWRRHGIAGLINTSLNGPGEPIVHSTVDARDCARRLGLDGVVIDGSLYRP
jgi:carbamoyltransferase